MKLSLVLAFILLTIVGCALTAENLEPVAEIEPIQARFDTEKLDELRELAQQVGSSSIVLMQEGKVIFSFGDIHEKHTIHSIRKPMLNSIFGIYVDRGVIDLDMTIGELGINDLRALSEQEMSATVRELLQSRSGIYHPSAATSEGMLKGMPERGTSAPGEQFVYNNWDFNVLGNIFETLTGKSIYQAYFEEIAKPLGMRAFQGRYRTYQDGDDISQYKEDGFYQYEPELSIYPAYHFRMSAYDMALFGQLYLNRGNWQGEQIISADWIEESTTSYSVTNAYMDFGYGYLWYVINPNQNRATKSFYHTGMGVHMLAVYPSSEFVFVHRVQTEQAHEFNQNDLYRLIAAVFAARID